jgi:hypothetical protein
MLKIRRELAALIAWERLRFPCHTQTERDAIGIRAARIAKLLRKARQIAKYN